jgi:ferredoxin
MKIVVNWSLCDGNGLCARQAPELLALDKNDTLHVLKENFGQEYLERAQQAVQVCPKAALSIAE